MNYTLIRARKRTLSLQVRPSGELIARAPLFLPKFLIDKFVQDKSNWVNKRRLALQKPQSQKTTYFTELELKRFIESQIKFYSTKMDLYPTSIRYTLVHSYWGTCNHSGRLSFNLALSYTPKEAVTYVVIHELAHLKWRGHGQRFWALVTKHCPETKSLRALLHKLPRVY
ncbi:MAG: YgjP-like metallopeptidase domain-containing protein [bacterium]